MANAWKIQHQGKGYNDDHTFYEIIVADFDTEKQCDKLFKKIDKLVKSESKTQVHKKINEKDCVCGFKGVHGRSLASHLGYYQR